MRRTMALFSAGVCEGRRKVSSTVPRCCIDDGSLRGTHDLGLLRRLEVLGLADIAGRLLVLLDNLVLGRRKLAVAGGRLLVVERARVGGGRLGRLGALERGEAHGGRRRRRAKRCRRREKVGALEEGASGVESGGECGEKSRGAEVWIWDPNSLVQPWRNSPAVGSLGQHGGVGARTPAPASPRLAHVQANAARRCQAPTSDARSRATAGERAVDPKTHLEKRPRALRLRVRVLGGGVGAPWTKGPYLCGATFTSCRAGEKA